MPEPMIPHPITPTLSISSAFIARLIGPNDAGDTLNLYDVSGLAHYELYRAITQAGNPSVSP